MNRMKSLEESVVLSMDGTDIRLFPFIPYILQDTWEIGSDPSVIIRLIVKHIENVADRKMLDLGCGKGVVSVRTAQALNCRCLGIDALAAFIEEANRKAVEYHVEHLCTFETGDIRIRINTLPKFDMIILGSTGPVLGDYFSTLTTLSKCLEKNGIIIIDDGYVKSTGNFTHPSILRKELILKQIENARMQLIDEVIIPSEDIRRADITIFRDLKNRCEELMDLYPDQRQLFADYIRKQEDENYILENEVVCSTMVLKRQQDA